MEEKLKLLLRIQTDFLSLRISNLSSRRQRLWELENSWGWDALSFCVRPLEAGQTLMIKRRVRDWTKNGPTYFELLVGESRDLSFHINDGWWEVEDAATLKNKEGLVRARYQVDSSPEAKQYDVFVGTVFSERILSIPPHTWLLRSDDTRCELEL